MLEQKASSSESVDVWNATNFPTIDDLDEHYPAAIDVVTASRRLMYDWPEAITMTSLRTRVLVSTTVAIQLVIVAAIVAQTF